MDYGVQLGRRFRALKLWWVLRCFGLSGIQERIRRHIEMAGAFAEWIDANPHFERLAPHPFSVVCFRAVPVGHHGQDLDQFNMKLMEHVNASGEIFLSHTKLDPGIALRVAIGNLATIENDIDRCQQLLDEGVTCLSNP
jgi:aromatic-L-amino-acid decarboxylase